MMDRANEFADIHAGLSSLTSDGWEGRTADHFRYKFNLQIKGWLDAQIAFSDASTAYQSYASTLLSAQSQCDEIRSRWEQGRNAVEQAQNNKADARSRAAAEGGTPMFDASCDEGPGRSTMTAAEDDFQALVNQVNESGTLLINALNSGISKLPERTWMDAVTRTLKSVYDGFVEATIDLIKLTWTLGGYAALYDFGRFICGYMTFDELHAKWIELPAETFVGLTTVLSENPEAFFEGLAKGLFDYDTLIDDPGRAFGHAIPDILITIATAGAGTGASAGSKGATRASKAARIGRAVFKELTHISDIEDIAHLSKLAFRKIKRIGVHAVTSLSDIAKNAAERLHDLSHAANGMTGALDGASDASRAARTGGAIGDTSHAAHAADGAADAAGSASHAAHAGGNTADAAGSASHASHGAADVKDSALPPTDPGHRSNGVSSAAQPAATPHASAAGDASTGGHAAPANTAPGTPNGAHNNAFMNADTGGTTHGAGGTANGATSAPASGAPATGAGTHGAPATGAPATGTHGAGSAADGATGVPDTPATPQKKRSFEEILGGGDKQHTANGTPDSPTTPKKDTPAGDALGGDKQPHGGKHAADTPATHADETADARKAGHGSGDANGSGKADADAKQGHDSGERADADPKAKDHSANGKADNATDSARHGDKTETDKPTSDKSHKEDDAAHHDGDEHPKDTDDKHTTKTDDTDTKSPKDDADTHKSDKDEADTHKSDKEDAGGKTDKDGDGKTDKDGDADGSGTVQDETDSSAEAVEDQPQINPESLAVFPEDYPTLKYIDSEPLNMRPINEFPELIEHPERMEPPTTIEELVERSPHRRPEPEWDNHELKDEGLGTQYKTAADITKDPLGQLSHGTHPEMKSTADWTRSRYHDPASGDAVWRTDVDHGAVPGTKKAYTDIKALTKDFGIQGLDRTSHVGGSFMAPIIDNVIIPNEYRGTPITSIHEPYRQYAFNVDKLPDGYKVEISIAAPEQGSLGGTPQIQVLRLNRKGQWRPMNIAMMLKDNIIKGVTKHVGEPQIPNFEAIKKLFDQNK